MTSSNLWTDGNALAGHVDDVLRVDVTTAIGRGITTRPTGLADGGPIFTIDFDFVDHQLRISTLDGRAVAVRSRASRSPPSPPRPSRP